MSSPVQTFDPGGGIERHWEVMADGLVIQRYGLHVAEWRDLARSGATADGVQGAPTVSDLCPGLALTVSPLIVRADMAAWVTIPYGLTAEHAVNTPHPGVLAPDDFFVGRLVNGAGTGEIRDALHQIQCAGAWWVGFFAAIRHLGVHHSTLQDCHDKISVDVLHRAVDHLGTGLAYRLLARLLPALTDAADRITFCGLLSRTVETESALPALIEELGELRLADLVRTAVPSRHQFTQYRGGTGPGQVE